MEVLWHVSFVGNGIWDNDCTENSYSEVFYTKTSQEDKCSLNYDCLPLPSTIIKNIIKKDNINKKFVK